jgi:hypothetical protein
VDGFRLPDKVPASETQLNFLNSRRYSQASPVSTTPAAKLPPVSTTPSANFATGFAGVVDTGGKFATRVNDTGGKFATGDNDTTPVANNRNNIRLLTN